MGCPSNDRGSVPRQRTTPVAGASASGEPAKTAAPPADVPSAPAPVAAAVELGRRLDPRRIQRDLARIARPRPPGSAHWRAVQRLCSTRLAELGYAVETHSYGGGTNVIGTRVGARPEEERVLLSAHYDHIGTCPGADDNASGVAALLEVARILSSVAGRRTLVVAFWDEEERGLLGSRAYAQRARERAERIAVAVSLDAIGFASSEPNSQRLPEGFDAAFPEITRELATNQNRGDFVAVLASTSADVPARRMRDHAPAFGLRVTALSLSPAAALAMPDALRSDHASFWLFGYPALLLTDTGNFRNPRYHCLQGSDDARSVSQEFVVKVARTVAAATFTLIDAE
jgi:hypothetical protein